MLISCIFVAIAFLVSANKLLIVLGVDILGPCPLPQDDHALELHSACVFWLWTAFVPRCSGLSASTQSGLAGHAPFGHRHTEVHAALGPQDFEPSARVHVVHGVEVGPPPSNRRSSVARVRPHDQRRKQDILMIAADLERLPAAPRLPCGPARSRQPWPLSG